MKFFLRGAHLTAKTVGSEVGKKRVAHGAPLLARSPFVSAIGYAKERYRFFDRAEPDAIPEFANTRREGSRLKHAPKCPGETDGPDAKDVNDNLAPSDRTDEHRRCHRASVWMAAVCSRHALKLFKMLTFGQPSHSARPQ